MPECATGPLLSLVALETSDDAGGKLIPAHTKLPSCSGPLKMLRPGNVTANTGVGTADFDRPPLP